MSKESQQSPHLIITKNRFLEFNLNRALRAMSLSTLCMIHTNSEKDIGSREELLFVHRSVWHDGLAANIELCNNAKDTP